MIRKITILASLAVSLLLAQQQERVVGTVETVAAAANELTLHTDAGKALAAHLAENCRLLRVEPGEKDLSKAEVTQLSAVSAGDRVIARGTIVEGSMTVATLVVMSRNSLAQKNAKEQAEWRTQGVHGVVKAVNTPAGELQISTGSNGSTKDWTVNVPATAVLRRYADGSVKFADARPAPLDAIEVGDQIRVLGAKDETASRIVAEQVVSGSFRTLGGEVLSVKPETGEMSMRDMQTRKPVVIRMTADTRIRRMPGFGAAAAGGTMRPGGAAGGMQRPGNTGGMQGGPMGGRAPDLAQMFERLPAATLADVKPGDAVIVSIAKPAGDAQPNAIVLVAGVDFLLRASAAQVNQTLGNWSTEMSMPGQ